MADEAAAPAANDTPAPVAAPTGNVSDGDAVAFLRERRGEAPATPEPAGAAEESPSQEEDAGPEEAPGEYEEGDEAGEPPIDAPRTWSKAEKEAFATLPREHQQSIVARESERDSHYQRGLQDAAAKSKAAEAKEQAAERARQQYEQHLPALRDQWQNYAKQTQDQFAEKWVELRSSADVARLRESDPIRWMEYRDDREAVTQAHASAQQADHNAKVAAQNQAAKDHENWVGYTKQEEAKFLEKAPEFKDAKKSAALAVEARTMFNDLGFSGEELTGAWDHGQPLSLRDHRVQLLVRDALRYRAAEKARKAAQPKPVPPVQRPGVATSRGDASQATIRDLTNKVKTTGSVDAAVALLRARRKAS